MTERCSECGRPLKHPEAKKMRCKACALEIVRQKRHERKMRPVIDGWKQFLSNKPRDPDADK